MRNPFSTAVFAGALFGLPVLAQVAVPALAGGSVDPIRDPAAKAVVLLFTRTDCPISNRYAPEVEALYEKYNGAGVRFWLVYVDPRESEDKMRQHTAEYGYRFGALLDRKHELVALTSATVTPEVAVYSGARMIYRGRIDDRYVSFGKARREPAERDLAEVLQAIGAGHTPSPRTTRAVGCLIEDLK